MRLVGLDPALQQKYERLCAILQEMGAVVIGFSGGVDSTLLLKVAHDLLGERCVAVIGDSEAFPEGEIEATKQIAAQIGARTLVVRTHELQNVHFRVNRPDRCYHCKSELFSKLKAIAQQEGIAWIADGSHADDASDFRPGMRAAEEQKVRSPLREAGLTKAEIRALAQALGLPNWDKPSLACLSSRFPYGTPITKELLAKVNKAEAFMRRLGFRQVRARHHDTILRLELEPTDLPRALELAEELVPYMKSLGYAYITLDLEGYRSGRMNEVLQRLDQP